MNERDIEQLAVLEKFLEDQQHAERQREKYLPSEVRAWLGEADKALGNDPES